MHCLMYTLGTTEAVGTPEITKTWMQSLFRWSNHDHVIKGLRKQQVTAIKEEATITILHMGYYHTMGLYYNSVTF